MKNTNIIDEDNKTAEKLAEEIRAMNSEAENFLDNLDKELEQVDIDYAKMLVQDDIDTLKIAKQILEEKKDQ